MSAIIITTPAGDNRTAVSLDDRVIGHIIDTRYGYHLVDVRPIDGQAVPIVVGSYDEGLALFMSLTFLPAGEECFSGFLQAVEVHGSTWVNEGLAAVTSLHFSSPHATGVAEFSVDFHLSADELRTLIGNLQFALAHLAVTA